MTEEQIFKNRFPEYCVGEECLSPYFDLFQIGFEEGEKQNEVKLDKAKGLIKRMLALMPAGYNDMGNSDFISEVREEAEQFLKGN